MGLVQIFANRQITRRVERAAQQTARAAAERLFPTLQPAIAEMPPAQVRGYVRAKSGLMLRREARLQTTSLVLPASSQTAVQLRATELVVDSAELYVRSFQDRALPMGKAA